MTAKRHLYVVDTITTIRNRYIIDAESLEHAYDEVTMLDSGSPGDYFEPFSQKDLGETIVDGRKISMKKFHKMNHALEHSPDLRESGSPWMGEQMIRRINYNDGR